MCVRSFSTTGVCRIAAKMLTRREPAGREHPLMAEWGRPIFANERLVSTKLPTLRFVRPCRQTAVTLNRSQRSSSCHALSFSAFSLRSPVRSKMAYANPLFICRDTYRIPSQRVLAL
jgi:hypothetical protein